MLKKSLSLLIAFVRHVFLSPSFFLSLSPSPPDKKREDKRHASFLSFAPLSKDSEARNVSAAHGEKKGISFFPFFFVHYFKYVIGSLASSFSPGRTNAIRVMKIRPYHLTEKGTREWEKENERGKRKREEIEK